MMLVKTLLVQMLHHSQPHIHPHQLDHFVIPALGQLEIEAITRGDIETRLLAPIPLIGVEVPLDSFLLHISKYLIVPHIVDLWALVSKCLLLNAVDQV